MTLAPLRALHLEVADLAHQAWGADDLINAFLRGLMRLNIYAYRAIVSILVPRLSRMWGGLFCTDLAQVRYFTGPVAIDLDDPIFSPQEVEILNEAHVRIVVLTTEIARSRLSAMGLRSKTAVIPQGVSLSSIRDDEIERIRQTFRSPGDVVVGYSQPYLLLRNDFRSASIAREMYSIDDLLQAFAIARSRVPHLRLWLIGQPSKRVASICAKTPGVATLGFVTPNQLLNYVCNFDIGVYPRFIDLGGRESVKLIETLACGKPVVAADVTEAQPIRACGGGIIVKSVEELGASLAALATDEALRKDLGQRGQLFGVQRDWDKLAHRYNLLLRDNFPEVLNHC